MCREKRMILFMSKKMFEKEVKKIAKGMELTTSDIKHSIWVANPTENMWSIWSSLLSNKGGVVTLRDVIVKLLEHCKLELDVEPATKEEVVVKKKVPPKATPKGYAKRA